MSNDGFSLGMIIGMVTVLGITGFLLVPAVDMSRWDRHQKFAMMLEFQGIEVKTLGATPSYIEIDFVTFMEVANETKIIYQTNTDQLKFFVDSPHYDSVLLGYDFTGD